MSVRETPSAIAAARRLCDVGSAEPSLENSLIRAASKAASSIFLRASGCIAIVFILLSSILLSGCVTKVKIVEVEKKKCKGVVVDHTTGASRNFELNKVDKAMLDTAKKHCASKKNGNVCVVEFRIFDNNHYQAICGRKR